MTDKWEEFQHKIHDEYRQRMDSAERNVDDLVKHVMLLLATILGISMGLSSLKQETANILYLKISWSAMLIAFIIGVIYLIYSGKRYRHNKYGELTTLSDIAQINMDKEDGKISESDYPILTTAAYHNWKRVPDISRYQQDDFYKKNEKIINDYKKKLPSAITVKKNDADLSTNKFHLFVASNTKVLNVSFYSITFMSLLFLMYHIIIYKS